MTHRWGRNTLLERLLHLLQVRQVADVAGDALRGRAEGGESVGDAQVDLAGVGLGGDGVDAAEACFLAWVLDTLYMWSRSM